MIPGSPVTCLYCKSPVHPSELSLKHTAFPWVRHRPARKASHCRQVMQICCCWQLYRKKQVWVLAYHSSFPQAKEQGRTPHVHSVDMCYVLALHSVHVWLYGWAGRLLPLIAPSSGAQGQPTICTMWQSLLQPIPWGRESKCHSPLNRHLSLPAVPSLRREPLTELSPDISFPDYQLLLTMELPIPPKCKVQRKRWKRRTLIIFLFDDLPGVSNIYTTSLICAYANFWCHI